MTEHKPSPVVQQLSTAEDNAPRAVIFNVPLPGQPFHAEAMAEVWAVFEVWGIKAPPSAADPCLECALDVPLSKAATLSIWAELQLREDNPGKRLETRVRELEAEVAAFEANLEDTSELAQLRERVEKAEAALVSLDPWAPLGSVRDRLLRALRGE